MPIKVHELKTLPEFFQAIWDEKKLFEIRKDDREFKVGDMVILKEWSPQAKYTGREMTIIITYVFKTKGGYGLRRTHCIFCWDINNVEYED